jgi:hypothetical protein
MVFVKIVLNFISGNSISAKWHVIKVYYCQKIVCITIEIWIFFA